MMKLVFCKNEQQEISVFSQDGDNTVEFNYIDMVKNLIIVKRLQEPEFNGDFSQQEKESVLSMINHINDEVTDFYSEDEE